MNDEITPDLFTQDTVKKTILTNGKDGEVSLESKPTSRAKTTKAEKQIEGTIAKQPDANDHTRESSTTAQLSETPPSSIIKNDGFDLSKLKLAQNFNESLGVKKAILTIPVRKPGKQEFVRVHPHEDMRMLGAVLELKDGGSEVYLVLPEIAAELPGEVLPKYLVTAVTRQGTLFVWHVKAPQDGERQNHWTSSMVEAAEMAKRKWVRVSANMQLGAYEVFEATGNLPEPRWPDLGFQQIIHTAFKGRIIDSMDHPVVRMLLGLE